MCLPLPLPLVLALSSSLLSLAPPVVASSLSQNSQSIYVRYPEIHARSPHAKHFVNTPAGRPDTARWQATLGATPSTAPVARASTGPSRTAGTHTGAQRSHHLRCPPDLRLWHLVHDPSRGQVCEDLVGCEGSDIVQLDPTRYVVMFDTCKEMCDCTPTDDHIHQMDQMERGAGAMGHRPRQSRHQ